MPFPPTSDPVERLAADQSTTGTALVDATGLWYPVLQNAELMFDFRVVFQTAAVTTGIQLALNGPASPALFSAWIAVPSSATAFSSQFVSAYNTGPATTAIDAANTPRIAILTGVIRNGPTAGSLVVRFRSAVSGSAVTVKQGSTVSCH